MAKIEPFESFDEMLEWCPKNEVILNTFVKAWNIVNRKGFDKILVSVSGGSDSDIVMDIMYRVDIDKRCVYVFFDTGLEYQATKKHICELERKYGVEIQRERAIKAIPTCCKEYGQPFVSKIVSKYIYNLQKHGFEWEDASFEELKEKYVGIESYLKWWCNCNSFKSYNVERYKCLKEFLVKNPPWFKISDKCCFYAKKKVAEDFVKRNGCNLDVVGIRRQEGGARSVAYKSCFEELKDKYLYMPLFFWKDEDKQQYEEVFSIRHSDCYEVYGFRRTGCACCPYGGIKDVNDELKKIKEHEPNLYTAVNNVFADSYRYMRMYEDFRQEMDAKHGKD